MAAKISIFVEGQTELIFVEKLLDEYLTFGQFKRESRKLSGKRAINLRLRGPTDAPLYILLYDVGGDGTLTSAILERGKKMVEEGGFSFLLGLRDLYSELRTDKEKIYISTEDRLKEKGLSEKAKIVYAIMEIEAWFLGDYSVFKKIDDRLTPDYIEKGTGRDLISEDPEQYPKPSNIINNIYGLIDRRYRKREHDSYEIAHRIDYNYLFLSDEIKKKVLSFHYFLKQLNKALCVAGF